MYERFIGYWDFLDNFSEAGTLIHPEESLELYFQVVEIPYECVDVVVQPTWDKGEYNSIGYKSKSDYEKNGFYKDGGEVEDEDYEYAQGGEITKDERKESLKNYPKLKL